MLFFSCKLGLRGGGGGILHPFFVVASAITCTFGDFNYNNKSYRTRNRNNNIIPSVKDCSPGAITNVIYLLQQMGCIGLKVVVKIAPFEKLH